MPVTAIALPQDPSSPSGRNTVIYMVRNKNNLEDLRLRRRIDEYNKQLGFRVKSHDFEKLDTYEFLRQLKDCDSDKMSHFRDIQESIRAMPTPDSMDVVNFSTAIQSLNLAICEQKTELPLLKKNVTNNSKSKMAKEEGEKLPNIIKRAKTEPTFNYSLLQTKVSHSGRVFKAPTPAWKPSAVPPKEPVMSEDELLLHHTLTIGNKKLVSASKKSVSDPTAELDVPSAPEQLDKPSISKSVRLVSGKRFTKSSGEDKGQGNLLLGKDLSDKEKRARTLSRRSHGHLEISDNMLKKLNSVNQYQSLTSMGSEWTQSEVNTPQVLLDETSGGLNLKSPDNKQKKSTQMVVSKSKHSPDLQVEEPGSFKSSPIFSFSTSLTKSVPSSNRGLLTRESSKVPQKLSLPTLLSLGLGELKNPKKYRYMGIQYAKTKPRSSYQKDLKEVSSESESDQEESDDEGVKEYTRGRRKSKQRKPVEVRMQNFFVEVDKLVEKPEKILVI